jgi:hypothetical protein
MKADQSTTVPVPTNPTPPSGLEHHGPLPPKDDASPLLIWLQSFWERLKTGRVGNPKWLALIVAVVLIGIAWWYFLSASRQSDSARWVQAETAALKQEGVKSLLEDPTLTDTPIGRITRLNQSRSKFAGGLNGLTAMKLADRQKAATNLEEARDEFTKLAEQFKSDRTLKSTCLLAAADAEMALVGIPKPGVQSVGLDAKQNGRGQIDKVVELKKQAAVAIGEKSDAGQKIIAEAEKLAKESTTIYEVTATLNAKFGEPDAVDGPRDSSSKPSAGDMPSALEKLPEPPVTQETPPAAPPAEKK